MQCAKGPFAKRPPADWDRIQKECPNIVRKVQAVQIDTNANNVFACTNYGNTNIALSKDPNSLFNNVSNAQSPINSNNNHTVQLTSNINWNNNNTYDQFCGEQAKSVLYNGTNPSVNMDRLAKIMSYV